MNDYPIVTLVMLVFLAFAAGMMVAATIIENSSLGAYAAINTVFRIARVIIMVSISAAISAGIIFLMYHH